MSVTFLDTTQQPQSPTQERPAPTTDPGSTTDLHEERTSDLAPATIDIDPPPMIDTPEEPAPPPLRRTERAARADTPGRVPCDRVAAQGGASTQRRAAPAPGTVLVDRYLIEQKVGSGGTALVYRARDMASSHGATRNTRVAIKMPRLDVDEERAARRLRHEFQHAQRLSHPNIVRVFELHERPVFMTMELLEARLLSTIVRDWTMLPPPLTHKILHGCAQALAHAHSRDIVHGDFKPGNVFVTPDEQVKSSISALLPPHRETMRRAFRRRLPRMQARRF